MRIGVLADVHANAHALDAAVAALAAAGVDAHLCAGDLVGYGPFPNECTRRVTDLAAACVAGNHDLIALDELPDDGCAALARRTLAWTRSQLAADVRARLAALPPRARLGAVEVAHGSLSDPREYVTTPARAAELLAALGAEGSAAEVLVVGHTHVPMAVAERSGPLAPAPDGSVALPAGERVLLNPGAVGQSREAGPVRARALVLDLERRTARFLAVAYDVEGCRRALRERGLPTRSVHLPPPGPLRARWRRGTEVASWYARRVRQELSR